MVIAKRLLATLDDATTAQIADLTLAQVQQLRDLGED
jgi:hypothetical protein